MKKLKIKRLLQEPGHCAIASSAIIANYYDDNVNYRTSKNIAQKKITEDTSNGLDSGEIALLLNYLGFNKVTLISSNLYYLDYSWARLSKKKLIENIRIAKTKTHIDYRTLCRSIYKFLIKQDYDNNLIINYNFGEYIRKYLKRKIPIIITFNWSMFFKKPKYNEKNIIDPFKGEYTEHAVVAYGYNKKGVCICDSHHEYYKYKLKKYRKGLYTISWENLMTIIGSGDIIIPENFYKE